MNTYAPWVAGLAIVLSATAIQAADMAGANAERVHRVYTDMVAPAEQQAYEAGNKSYNKCLAEHGVKFGWTAWLHQTGDTYTYSYASDAMTWADFDAMREQGKACDAVWQSQANPHLKSETSAFMVERPDMSHPGTAMDKPGAIMGVTLFKLKIGHKYNVAFTDAVKQIAAAEAKSHWPYYNRFMEIRYAGPGAPQFIVVDYSKNWAEFGTTPNPTLWNMVENTYGKAKAKALREQINDALESMDSHIDSYSEDMSYIPAGH